jgi:DNA repair protein SbcC/Rad50
VRPDRLAVEGFTAFRQPVEVDFTGADLFALTGPTGSGKSSLIDAMTFALYGSVPRLGAKAVAPIISQGLLEARVRLDFSVGGVGHTAVRVVRASEKGATTREARLERVDDDIVLASDARGMTAAVEDLLGLSFDHFCTCVVLPQGEFAALLHAEPRKRQDMLVALLDLGLYNAMGQAARSRATAAQAQVEILDADLVRLADATDEAIHDAERRVGVLDRLVERIDETGPRLEELATLVAGANAEVTEATARIEALAGLAVPADVEALAEKVKEGRLELDQLQKDHRAAEHLLERAEAALVGMADGAVLTERLGQLTLRDDLGERIEKGESLEKETSAALAEATAAREAADATFAQAQVAVVTARDRYRAEALAAELVAGAPCPVCRQVVHQLPHHDPAPDLDQAEAHQTASSRAMQEAHDREREAQREHDRVTSTLAEVRQTVAEVDQQLGDGLGRGDVEAALADLARRAKDLQTARDTERQRRRDRDAGQARASKLAGEETALWRRFDEARDALAPLGPPPAERAGLVADWQALVTWADQTRPAQEERATAARSRVEEAEAERIAIDERIRATCAELDVVVGDGPPRDAATAARERASTRHETLVNEQASRHQIEAQRAGLVERQQVADELGRHLRADHFEKWILDEAIQRLVAGATEILLELSGGAYSLTLDGSGANFAVVDHANASAVRGAKTLSGGETFLASLALALALADQVADLAAGGGARLESIFCDEGFGSLDLDTLDVVAAALEELGAAGRMVGVVTHIRELAERMPVRFEVRKGPVTATVERSD